MKKMPSTIKNRLRRINNLHHKINELDDEIQDIMKSYGVEYDFDEDDKNEEAYIRILNGDMPSDIEDVINEVERIFLKTYNSNKI